jgi:hypothetical protein
VSHSSTLMYLLRSDSKGWSAAGWQPSSILRRLAARSGGISETSNACVVWGGDWKG